MAHRTKTQFATDITTYIKSAGVPSKTTAANHRTLEGLAVDSVMWGGTTQGDWHTSGGVGTGGFGFRNPALTYATTIVGGAVTADRTINLPVVIATDTFMTLGLGQTITAMKRFQHGTISVYSSGNTVYHNIISQQSGIPCNLYIPDSGVSASDYVMTSRASNLAIYGAKRFQPNALQLANSADTYYATLNGGEQTANYTASLPVLSADVTIATTGANTFTGAQSLPVGSNVGVWKEFVLNYATVVADGGSVYEIFSLPAAHRIESIVMYNTQAWAGTSLTAMTAKIGIATDTDKYAADWDIFQTVGGTVLSNNSVSGVESMTAATSIRVTLTLTGGIVANLTAGNLKIFYKVASLPLT